MKRTFLAMVMAGSCMTVFAQTTPTTPTTPTSPTNPTTTPTTTSPATSTTPTTGTAPTTNTGMPATTTSTPDPLSTTPNTNMNNPTTVNTSSTWAPGTSPYWGWNSYGIWNSNANTNTNVNTSVNTSASATTTTNTAAGMPATTDAGSMNSAASYDAYGTAVTALPANVQRNFGKEYPGAAGQQYTWNQYGEWFHTYYTNQGRLTQYFYDQRGNGYSLSLPVVQTYVPEDIIDKALQKHGARLYSIGMVKAADSGNVYQLGVLERGQIRMEYLHEDGSSVTNVWRVEEPAIADMSSTSTNAALGNTEAAATTEQAPTEEKELKTKWKENGVKTKIKTEEGKVKIKQKKVDD